MRSGLRTKPGPPEGGTPNGGSAKPHPLAGPAAGDPTSNYFFDVVRSAIQFKSGLLGEEVGWWM